MIRVLVGMIASGKSTYARELARDGWVVVNDDALVAALHGGDYGLYRKELKPLYKATELQIVHTAIALGRPVVVDRGLNISPAARQRWVAVARSLDVPAEAVEFPNEGPAVHAARRFASDNRGHNRAYWTRVAERHAAEYVSPTLAEGFAAVCKEWPARPKEAVRKEIEKVGEPEEGAR